jgi:hypothetical protein
VRATRVQSLPVARMTRPDGHDLRARTDPGGGLAAAASFHASLSARSATAWA